VYFDRADVKKAIHAPQNVNWVICADVNNIAVFPNGDASDWPAFTVLPTVIEKSHRSVIAHGLTDMLLMADGARIVLQKVGVTFASDDNCTERLPHCVVTSMTCRCIVHLIPQHARMEHWPDEYFSRERDAGISDAYCRRLIHSQRRSVPLASSILSAA